MPGPIDYGFNNVLSSGGATSNFGMAPPQTAPGGIGGQDFNFMQNYGASPSALRPSFDWGQLGNAFSAGAGGLSFIEGVKDLFGRSDADKQRKFAKDWSMRQWNTNALMHDNQLQRTRNIQNDYNRVHGTNYGSNEGLRTLGTWGSGKNRVPSGG
jgi:hypothetical protein